MSKKCFIFIKTSQTIDILTNNYTAILKFICQVKYDDMIYLFNIKSYLFTHMVIQYDFGLSILLSCTCEDAEHNILFAEIALLFE